MGRKHSEETKKKISKKAKERYMNGFKHPRIGKGKTDGSFKKNHSINLNKKRSKLVCKKLSISKLGEKNPNWKGGRSKDNSYYSKIDYNRRKNSSGSYSRDEWENLKKEYNYKCPSCGLLEPHIKLTADHIIPVSLEGTSFIDNIQPLCRSCNSRKRTKTIKFKYETSSLVIGAGEIGKSLFNILDKEYDTYIIDKNEKHFGIVKYLHICFPYSDKFEEYVKEYQEQYKPKFTVIHSTVKVGTSRRLNAIFSPCIGIHPHLEESIKTFTKYLSGPKASEVAQYFRRAGIKVYLTDKQETTELMKQLSTTFYGVMIEYTKEVKRICDETGVPFEFWTLWTDNYNKGYKKLGYPEFTRPNLVPIMANIKGHCIIPNADLLKSDFAKFISERNK